MPPSSSLFFGRHAQGLRVPTLPTVSPIHLYARIRVLIYPVISSDRSSTLPPVHDTRSSPGRGNFPLFGSFPRICPFVDDKRYWASAGEESSREYQWQQGREEKEGFTRRKWEGNRITQPASPRCPHRAVAAVDDTVQGGEIRPCLFGVSRRECERNGR